MGKDSGRKKAGERRVKNTLIKLFIAHKVTKGVVHRMRRAENRQREIERGRGRVMRTGGREREKERDEKEEVCERRGTSQQVTERS